MGRVRGGQPPLLKEGQVRVNPGLHLRAGGVGGAGVTSSLHPGAEVKINQNNWSSFKLRHFLERIEVSFPPYNRSQPISNSLFNVDVVYMGV